MSSHDLMSRYNAGDKMGFMEMFDYMARTGAVTKGMAIKILEVSASNDDSDYAIKIVNYMHKSAFLKDLTPDSGLPMSPNLRVVKALVDMGWDINTKSANTGNTLLHASSRFNDGAYIDALLMHGASKTCTNAMGKTPEDVARMYRNNQAVKVFESIAGNVYRPGPQQSLGLIDIC